MKAYLKPDPKYAVTPRPKFQKQGGQEVCEKQADFLDYKLDNLPFRPPEKKTVKSAALKGTGILKIWHRIKREKRRREEEYEGTPEGLEEFLRNWPDAIKEYPNFIKQLQEGKDIHFVADFKETTYNDPGFSNIDLKDFFVRIKTDGYEGLKTTKLVAERQEYYWWDLEKEEERGFFYDIDELSYEKKEEGKDPVRYQKYENKLYDDIYECTFYTKLKETDKEDTKCKFWISRGKKVMIGSILYPYYGMDIDYVPHYIKDEVAGFYQPGVAEDLTDSHVAENVLINHILEAAWMRNMITPIIEEGSDIAEQFLEKRWTHGIPIEVKNLQSGKIDFLQKYMQQVDLRGLLTIMQYLKKNDDDVTGVSSLMSGREDPVDPSAPARKTALLLHQSGMDIEEYILGISPAFNTIGYTIFAMYYQIAQDGVEYAVKPDRVVEGNPFALLTRSDMIAKTNIQVQAAAFAIDRLEEYKKDVVLFQLLRPEPLFNSDPNQVYTMLRAIVKDTSEKWSNLVDQLLTPPAKLQQMQIMTAMKSTELYIKRMLEEAKVTNQAPAFDVRALAQMIGQGQKLLATPPSKEEIQQAKESQNA